MASAKYSREEIAQRGETLFTEQIEPRLDEGDHGKYVILDIESGQWEIDASDASATKRILQRLPSAVLYGLRVGFPTAYRLGGRFAVIAM